VRPRRRALHAALSLPTLALLALLLPAQAQDDAVLIVDDFDTPEGWTALPADGVDLTLGSAPGWKGNCLRLDFDFHGGGGYAVAHKDVDLDLPENYAFRFRLRGEAPVNHLEFKLIDETGENVWWCVRRDVHFPEEWRTVTIKKRQISFAWGPLGGGEIRHVAAIEMVVTAGSGGEGTVWVDDLELRRLPPPGTPLPPPEPRASSQQPGHEAAQALDGDPATSWQPRPDDSGPWITLDFTQPREFGGLTLVWAPEAAALRYRVEISDDGTEWSTIRMVENGNGGRDDLYLPESEARFVRIALPPGGSGQEASALAELVVQPLSWASSRNAFFETRAAEAPRGTYPRGFSGEQAYWTVVGVNGGTGVGLLGEDGAIEPVKGGFSVEPFLFLGDSLVTWADVEARQSLAGGCLPLPSVVWETRNIHLTITAFGTGDPGASSIGVRYRLQNRGGRPVSGTLFLAVRPFQVNPPSQFLNTLGGTAPIGSLGMAKDSIRVNGDLGALTLTRPEAFGAVPYDSGDIVADYLRRGRLPASARVDDPFAAASGALAFPFTFERDGEQRTVNLLFPLHPESPLPSVSPGHDADAWMKEREKECFKAWGEAIQPVQFHPPSPALAALNTMESQLTYILLERSGPALQPGTRAYARSWIRDGALTSSALLRLGHSEAVREFIAWYAPHQYANGKIPCVVDGRGADPVPEHDSSGEFIFLVAEYYRYTGDRDLAEAMWPRIRAAAGYLDSLRRETRTAEYRTPERAEFYGLLPPSISHEGYSAKPMHSYWDDFFAYRGFTDAAYLAAALGRAEEASRFGALRDTFAADVAASVKAAMARHDIPYVPGCADLGDFDATSTTIAFDPTGAAAFLPPAAVDSTFQRYYEFFLARREGTPWEAFTPYEMRNIGAFVRLGWRDRAGELLDFFLSQQRPSGWNQWPEVVTSNLREPRFLGDLPHSWVGSDYIRSVLDMFAYVRESDSALVVGAGIPPSWVQEAPLSVEGLRTPFGRLRAIWDEDSGDVQVSVSGDLRIPAGGIRVVSPLAGAPRGTRVNRVPVEAEPNGEVLVRELPAVVLFRR